VPPGPSLLTIGYPVLENSGVVDILQFRHSAHR
jgi:hypothetical protein